MPRSYHFATPLVLLALLAGCSAGRSEAPQPSDTPADSASVAMNPEDPEFIPVTAPAPGTAVVEASVLACEAAEQAAQRCTVRIERVVEYGAAVAPLAEGEELVVLVSERAAQRAAERAAQRAGAEATPLVQGARLRLTLRQPGQGADVPGALPDSALVWATFSMTRLP